MTGPWNNPVPVGSMIADKYRVERMLGFGGMGTVVAARHVELDELRAIKVMHSFEGDTRTAAERFTREARAAARLKSEHVAKVYDVGRTETGLPYIVMEYLEGADLSEIARKRRVLPIGEATSYIIQACDAIAEAHASGIVHRDLKPANLFLTTRDDGTPCIKVLDFGISKQLGSSADLDMTTTQDVLGSPHYMSPEQMRSTRTTDARSDLWALGVILYRLVTGKLPFPADTPIELCAKVLETVPPAPNSVRPEVSPELGAIILRCLEKDPAQRMPSARELAAALLPFACIDALDGVSVSRRLGITLSASNATPASGAFALRPSFMSMSGNVGARGGELATTGRWGAWRSWRRTPARFRRDVIAGSALGALGLVAVVAIFFSWRPGGRPRRAAGEELVATGVEQRSADGAQPATVAQGTSVDAAARAAAPVVRRGDVRTEAPSAASSAPEPAITPAAPSASSARSRVAPPPKKPRAAGSTSADPFGRSRK